MIIIISSELTERPRQEDMVKRRFTVEGQDFWVFSQDADEETIAHHVKLQGNLIRRNATEQCQPKEAKCTLVKKTS